MSQISIMNPLKSNVSWNEALEFTFPENALTTFPEKENFYTIRSRFLALKHLVIDHMNEHLAISDSEMTLNVQHHQGPSPAFALCR